MSAILVTIPLVCFNAAINNEYAGCGNTDVRKLDTLPDALFFLKVFSNVLKFKVACHVVDF